MSAERTQIADRVVITGGGLKKEGGFWMPKDVEKVITSVGERRFVTLHGNDYSLAGYVGWYHDQHHAVNKYGFLDFFAETPQQSNRCCSS